MQCPKCKLINPDTAERCDCGYDFQSGMLKASYIPQLHARSSLTDVNVSASGPVGIGGWLVLIAIGLVLAPLRLFAFLMQTFVPILRDGTWAILTTPGSEAYHPLWAPLLVFELIGNIGFIAACFWLLNLFFRRARRFPRFFIWVALLNPPFILVDAWVGSFVLPNEPMLDGETAKEVGRSIATVAIWVPYMHVSRRVRNTFIT